MGREAHKGPNRAPMEWFVEATRWYVQGHQGCACCRGQHCVFRSAYGPRVEYYCTACDFSVCHDQQSGLYFATPGEQTEQAPGALLGAEELWEVRAALGPSATPEPAR
jgi:hypothetical protein